MARRRCTVCDISQTLSSLQTWAGNESDSQTKFADGSRLDARLLKPRALAWGPNGTLYVADGSNRIRTVSPLGIVSTLAGSGEMGGADAINGSRASFHTPSALAVDSAGHVYVADSGNNCIRKISPEGSVSTLAGLCSTLTAGYSVDGFGTAAKFYYPSGIVVRPSDGTIYVSDTWNNRICAITPAGNMTNFAGDGSGNPKDGSATTSSTYQPQQMAMNATGIIFAESGNLIRFVSFADGTMSTVAGDGARPGSATAAFGTNAGFSQPTAVAIDEQGTMFVTDSSDSRVRAIASTGYVATLFVSAISPVTNVAYAFADGPLAVASSLQLTSLVLTPDGRILIAEPDSNVIRVMTLAPVVSSCGSGTFCPNATLTQASASSCPIGSFCPTAGLSAPVACTPGTFCGATGLLGPSGNCVAGFYCPSGSAFASAVQCPAGSSCPGGSGAARICGIGAYCPTAGLSIETPCDIAHFCNTTGQTAWTAACPVATFCPLAGMSAAAPCSAGSYCNSAGQSNVTGPCDAGFYCPAGSSTPASAGRSCPFSLVCPQGSGAPAICTAGSFCNASGLSAPTAPCAQGYRCPPGSTLPIRCEAGSYCNSTGLSAESGMCPAGSLCAAGSAAPLACSAGVYCATSGLSAASAACPIGFFCRAGASTPAPCPLGSYCASSGLSAPSGVCAPGSYSNSRNGISACSSCAPGLYSSSAGATDCRLCLAGTFASSAGSTACRACPPDSTCLVGAASPIAASVTRALDETLYASPFDAFQSQQAAQLSRLQASTLSVGGLIVIAMLAAAVVGIQSDLFEGVAWLSRLDVLFSLHHYTPVGTQIERRRTGLGGYFAILASLTSIALAALLVFGSVLYPTYSSSVTPLPLPWAPHGTFRLSLVLRGGGLEDQALAGAGAGAGACVAALSWVDKDWRGTIANTSVYDPRDHTCAVQWQCAECRLVTQSPTAISLAARGWAWADFVEYRLETPHFTSGKANSLAAATADGAQYGPFVSTGRAYSGDAANGVIQPLHGPLPTIVSLSLSGFMVSQGSQQTLLAFQSVIVNTEPGSTRSSFDFESTHGFAFQFQLSRLPLTLVATASSPSTLPLLILLASMSSSVVIAFATVLQMLESWHSARTNPFEFDHSKHQRDEVEDVNSDEMVVTDETGIEMMMAPSSDGAGAESTPNASACPAVITQPRLGDGPYVNMD